MAIFLGNGYSTSGVCAFDNVLLTIHTLPDCDSDGIPDSVEIRPEPPIAISTGFRMSATSHREPHSMSTQAAFLTSAKTAMPMVSSTRLTFPTALAPTAMATWFRMSASLRATTEQQRRPERVRDWSGAPDCNANGVPDACDISSGSSQDINFNGVPDECDNSFLGYSFESALVQDDSGYYTVTDVYAAFSSPYDTLLNIFNVQVWPSSGAGFVQNDLAGGHWSPTFCSPSTVSLDSFVLIGGLPTSANTTFLDPAFGKGTQSVPPMDAGWFNSNPINLQGRVDPKTLRTWIGRFVHEGCDASVFLLFKGTPRTTKESGPGPCLPGWRQRQRTGVHLPATRVHRFRLGRSPRSL